MTFENTCRECNKKTFTKKDLVTMLQHGISTCHDCIEELARKQKEEDEFVWLTQTRYL